MLHQLHQSILWIVLGKELEIIKTIHLVIKTMYVCIHIKLSPENVLIQFITTSGLDSCWDLTSEKMLQLLLTLVTQSRIRIPKNVVEATSNYNSRVVSRGINKPQWFRLIRLPKKFMSISILDRSQQDYSNSSWLHGTIFCSVSAVISWLDILSRK